METKITYEDQLEHDALVKSIESYNAVFYYKKIYKPDIGEMIKQLSENFKSFNFTNTLICIKKLKIYIDGYINNELNTDYYLNDVCELGDLLEKVEEMSVDFQNKGLENYNKEEDVELTEKEKLKIKKSKIESRLKEIQEINAPYLNMSLGLAFVMVSVIFYCIPSFFGKITTNHVCSFMLVAGVLFLFSEIKIRQNENIGWIGYSDKITSKKASVLLLQSFVYMIPLTVLYFFFSNILLIKILFFIQVWLCSVIMINGITLLIVSNISKQAEKKFNIWGFILGAISVIGFVIQILQLFKVI